MVLDIYTVEDEIEELLRESFKISEEQRQSFWRQITVQQTYTTSSCSASGIMDPCLPTSPPHLCRILWSSGIYRECHATGSQYLVQLEEAGLLNLSSLRLGSLVSTVPWEIPRSGYRGWSLYHCSSSWTRLLD